MEDLFLTNLTIEGRDIAYHVVFEEEEYRFKPVDAEGAPGLSFSRAHDEWIAGSDIDGALKTQAIDALEKYLLRQH